MGSRTCPTTPINIYDNFISFSRIFLKTFIYIFSFFLQLPMIVLIINNKALYTRFPLTGPSHDHPLIFNKTLCIVFLLIHSTHLIEVAINSVIFHSISMSFNCFQLSLFSWLEELHNVY